MSLPADEWRSGLEYGAEASPRAADGRGQPAAGDGATLAGAVAALGAHLSRIFGATCSRIWAGIEVRRAAQRRRTLRVMETVAMGEKRFVAIVQVEEQRFLVGGGAAGVSLLARLDHAAAPDHNAAPDFASILHQQQADPASSATRIREAW